MTVEQFCKELGWTISDLARNAGISWQAADNAYKRRAINQRTKRDICTALSTALNRSVQLAEVTW